MSLQQTPLPFKLEAEEKDNGVTSYAGLPLVIEAFRTFKLPQLIKKHLRLKQSGWSDSETIESLVALIASGGEHLDDIQWLQADQALSHLWNRKTGDNNTKELPSPKALERYLKRFHDQAERPEKAGNWVPEESEALKNLQRVQQEHAKKMIRLSGLKRVTIENDATVVFSHKDQAQGTYKGGKGYMPVLGVIAELGIIVADEFRDGNVSPDHDAIGFFKVSLKSVPKGVKVRTRLDGAYYQHDLMSYLKKKDIEFTISADKSTGMMRWIEAIEESAWKPLLKQNRQGAWVETGQEYAEFDWTSAEGTRKSMKERNLRIVVTRKTQKQWELFKEEFNAEIKAKDRYEAIATNMNWQAPNLIRWHHEKAGSIEHSNARIKNDLAGGVLPCAEFGANAAWWRIQTIAWNVIRVLQIHALPESLRRCHLKALRFKLLCLAGKVIKHARQIILKLSDKHPSFEIYRQARANLMALAVP